MKKLLALFLCLLMVASVVIGCTGEKTPGGETGGTKNTGDQTSDGGTTGIHDDLPADLNFNDMSIRTAYREDKGNYFVGEDNAEIVDVAIYKANQVVDERLKIKREWEPIADEVLTDTITKAILTGDESYDYVPVDQFYGSQFCATGLYKDLSDLPYVDYEKPWYYKEYMESLSLGKGTIFYIAGDIYPIITIWTSAIFWNKTIYGDVIDADMLSLYKLVDAGGWTFDKYNEMVRKAYIDIDKDGQKSAGDGFGTINSVHGSDHLAFSMGFKITEKNDAGYYDVVVDTEKNSNILDKIRDQYNKNDGFYCYNPAIEGGDYPIEKFANDECLFAQQFFIYALSDSFRNMRSEFGIVPLPKFDETQENYIGTIHNSAFFVGVPVNVDEEKLDAIGALIEAQSSENYRSVSPVIFEEALKIKYNRDEENAEYTNKMIDLIRDNYRIDFAYVYSNACSDLGRIMSASVTAETSLSQIYAERMAQVQQGLADLFESFEEFKSGKTQ